ncbi:UNVERIFIED_CONTAM: Bcr/CflA subfamily drug resistance transporter [Williamsia faeni]
MVRPIEGQPNAREPDATTRTNGGAFGGGIAIPMFLALVLLSATAPLATDLYLPGLPTVADSLGTTNVATQLTLTTFMFGMGVGQLLTGALSDGWGRRRLLIGGTIAFVVASVLCALAPSIAVLIAARLLQGFAGGMGIVLSRAVISDRARGDNAARLFSLMMLVGATAPVVAPILGGVLLSPIGWRGIFWVLAGIGAVMLLGVLTVIPETLPKERRHGISLTRLAANFGKVLRNRRFVAYTATLALSFGVMFSYISASPFVVQEIFGFSASQFSIVFAVNSVGLVLASAINARLIGRVQVRSLLRFGLILISSSSVVLLVLGREHAGLDVAVLAFPVRHGARNGFHHGQFGRPGNRPGSRGRRHRLGLDRGVTVHPRGRRVTPRRDRRREHIGTDGTHDDDLRGTCRCRVLAIQVGASQATRPNSDCAAQGSAV